jgi:hypothetical protein
MGQRAKQLSVNARQRLREHAIETEPWRLSTGPRTVEGKRVSSLNALKHGRETAMRRAFRRDAIRFIRLAREFRRCITTGGPVDLDTSRVVDLTALRDGLLQHLRTDGIPGLDLSTSGDEVATMSGSDSRKCSDQIGSRRSQDGTDTR